MTSLPEQLLASVHTLSDLGLNRGTAGNASVRGNGGFWITPSGMPPAAMAADDMVWMELDGNCQGSREPSSEWRFHYDILLARPEVNAVIHTHAMFCTTLACLRRDIPPFHYMIALAGGDSIRCAPYALFGSQALSDVAVEALKDRHACLLANHGMIALGRDLDHALAVAVEVETLAEQYWRALQVGPPALLDAEDMQAVFAQFQGYGNWRR